MAHSYTVLVVERTDFVRRVTTRTLAESGCQVLEAASADEALALLERPNTRVDLVLIGAVGSVERGQLSWEFPQIPQVGSPYSHLTGEGGADQG